MPDSRPPPNPYKSSAPPRRAPSFGYVVLLEVALLGLVALLGGLQVLGEDNVVRLSLGVTALIVWTVRQWLAPGKGGGGGTLLLLGATTLGVSELGASIAGALP